MKNFAKVLRDSIYDIFIYEIGDAEVDYAVEDIHNELNENINLLDKFYTNNKKATNELKKYAPIIGESIVNAIIKAMPDVIEKKTMPVENLLNNFSAMLHYNKNYSTHNLNKSTIKKLWEQYINSEELDEYRIESGYYYIPDDKVTIKDVINYIENEN